MRAVLEYTDCLNEGNKVYKVLAQHKILVLNNSCVRVDLHRRVTVYVHDWDELNALVIDLNTVCHWQVAIIKTKPDSMWYKLKQFIFNEGGDSK